MMWKHGMLAGALLISGNCLAAAMALLTLDAEILDTRVTRCGVTIDGDGLMAIKPFIETVGDLRGRLDISVSSRSGSNVNMTRQSVGFSGNSIITVGQSDSMEIKMTARAAGVELCRLSREVTW